MEPETSNEITMGDNNSDGNASTYRAVQQFFRRLVEEGDRDSWEVFLMTYRKLVSASELISIWVALFSSKLKEEAFPVVTRRLIDFLDVWVLMCKQLSVNDFHKRNLVSLIDFMEQLNPTMPLKNEIKLKLVKIAKFNQPGHKRSLSGRMKSLGLSSSGSQNQFPAMAELTDLTGLPTADIATSMTIIDFKLFSNVKLSEIMEKVGWLGKRSQATSVNILKLINRCNEVSGWVATEVLQRIGKAQRACVQKFIEVALKCEKMNNFNTMWAIIAGLNNSSVSRLTVLWSTISEKHQKDFEYLEHMMSPDRGFKNYLEQLRSRSLPVLPYFGLFLRDLVFSSENPIYNSATQTIDFEAMRMVAGILRDIQRYKSVPYNSDAMMANSSASPYVNMTALFEKLQGVDDDELLYKLSLQSQPVSGTTPGISYNTGSTSQSSKNSHSSERDSASREEGYVSSGSELSTNSVNSANSLPNVSTPGTPTKSRIGGLFKKSSSTNTV